MALNYSAIDALTRKKYIPELKDTFFQSTPLLKRLQKKQKEYDGGPKIVEPLIYGELLGGKSYSMYDTVNPDQTTPITAAEFSPKNLVVPFIISRDEERQNSGSDTQVISLLDAKWQIARKTMVKMFATQLYSDGTGNSGKDLTGLLAAVADSGTYGGIDRATHTWWKARVDRNSGVARSLTTDLMLKMFINISDGDDQPDLIVCDNKTWAVYHNLVKGQIQYQTEPVREMANYGFQTLEFRGIPVVADPYCTDGTANGVMYFLNTRYIYLRVDSGTNFYATKMRQADDMIAYKKELLWTGNLTCSNCKRQGVIKDIDVSDWS